MASVAADMSVDMLSAPYDAQDPSAPDPGQPKRAYVPGTLAQPGESIFGGAAHVERPRDELDALFADDEDIAPPARPVGRIEEDLAREDHEPVVSIEDHDASIAEQRRAARALEEASNAQNTGLGIDEEVKQRKPRVPRAKLDHERLCSEKGIPRLRRITKDRLKFKGKGHEFSDVARMLNMYQLWLDDLFPKAKFADGLAMIEKVGHQKHMQVMRKAWIDEGKPRPYNDDDTRSDDGAYAESTTEQPTNESDQPAAGAEGSVPHEDDDDLYGAPDSLFVPETRPAESQTQVSSEKPTEDLPEEDELDFLLNEARSVPPAVATVPRRNEDDEFADAEEAMAGMEWD